MFYKGESVYTEKFDDQMGLFFTEEEFPELKRKPADVSGILQQAIGRLMEEQCYGIIYIPEGEYPICNTVLIPPSIRLIGYGKKRPVFVLPEYAIGYEGSVEQEAGALDKKFGEGYPGANYMFWFIGNRNICAKEPMDANAATFYSAISNIDFRIEGNHPGAICLRVHFAQHGFISHCHFELGNGLAAMYDVGNEMEDLSFRGGSYGIICRMCSPGWPFALLDSVFEDQKKAAVLSGFTGFTGFRLTIRNTPKAFALYIPKAWEKLYLEDCIFENISESAINFFHSDHVVQQTNGRRIYCKNVPAFVTQEKTGRVLKMEEDCYVVNDYLCGYLMSDITEAEHEEIIHATPIEKLPEELVSDIPALPPMKNWVSVKQYGAVGDGVTDDTVAIQRAMDTEQNLYFPQGIYHVTNTLRMNEGNVLIGMSPITTQLVLVDDEPQFAGFGTPKAVLQTAKGGMAIVNGIGIDTAGKNPRAVGIKWMAGEASYMNDVKFVGGHGLMFRDGRNAYAYLYNATRTADYDPDRVWDFQYSSLWITNNGGGVFKDLWSASPYAEAGIAITNTSTPGVMYAISLEHHARHEMKLNRVSNWRLYALQTEEEKAEGIRCIGMELVSCENITIANYFLFRVIAVNKPMDTGIRIWNCKKITFMNLHNKAQMQYIFTTTLRDHTTGFFAKSPEYGRLLITGEKKENEKAYVRMQNMTYEVVADGFEYAQGAVIDKDGNLYWCDKDEKRIYCYQKTEDLVVPISDIHFYPAALALDTQGHLIVAADYTELKKTIPGQPFQTHDRTNYHPFFSWFARRSEKVYSIDPTQPYDTMEVLDKSELVDVEPAVVYRPAHMDYPGMYHGVIESPMTQVYMAPDGVTGIEATEDLARSLMLEPVKANSSMIVTDDHNRLSYRYEVDNNFQYSREMEVANRGQYGVFCDKDEKIWTVEDRLYVFDRDGECISSYPIPWDAYGIIGNEEDIYLIGRSSIYRFCNRC